MAGGGRCESVGLESGQAGDQHDEPLAPRRQSSESAPSDRDLMGRVPRLSRLKGLLKESQTFFDNWLASGFKSRQGKDQGKGNNKQNHG